VIVENDNRFHLAVTPSAGKRLSEAPLNRWCRIERLDVLVKNVDGCLISDSRPRRGYHHTIAPLGDPLVIRVRGALLALRKREASWIFVE